ncbi:acyltransferase [Nocardia uniformis]|uniref:Acyltransferase n=1 Tax=Nocardia uniformis TaxID=53432 RepID=A0A849C1T8_9NOCA|nr:acyltransferase family protein [Nocardia uniformis]NNH72682.1 acyltransferase [Nocardia uniformis]
MPVSSTSSSTTPTAELGGATARRVDYRHDLDGLRGIAIALVVIFHIWYGRVSGGVDVFLVLSGFFFTGMLLRRADTGSVGVVPTLRRTLRRLLPAMVVVLAAVAVATVLLQPYTRWSDMSAQTLASLFYYQNWYLATSWTNYLAADPAVSPLQHLWSMSVQGQMYLVMLVAVAAVAWGCRRFGRTRLVALAVAGTFGALSIASFIYAAQGVSTQQGWNYYDTFARAWEPLVGALLAIAAPYISLPRIARSVLAIAGLAAVLACGWLVDGAARFPGPDALLPVGATVALIAAGANTGAAEQPWVSRLLGTAPAVRLGSLAYSLYLWHWPILIFMLGERNIRSAGLVGGIAVITASLLLAYATNRFIEEPLRMRAEPTVSRSHRLRMGLAISTVGLLLIGGTAVWQVINGGKQQPVGNLDPVRYPGAEALANGAPVPQAEMRPTIQEAPADNSYPTRDNCISDFDTRAVITCEYGDTTAERTIAVVGNSHAEHWVPALHELALAHHFRLTVFLKMGCPLTVAAEPMYKGLPIPDCRDWSQEVIDRLAEDRPDWVFTTSTRPASDGGDETPDDYLDVWSALSNRDLNVLAIRDTPWLRRGDVRYRAIDCLAAGGDRFECGMKRTDALSPVDPAAAPAANFPQVYTLDLSNAVCEPEVCAVVEGNILVYHDEHHFTASYARSLAPELGRHLNPILGWW